MNSLKMFRGCCGILSIAALLCSCSSAVFPEVIEDQDTVAQEDEETTFTTKKGTKIELSMPEEGSSLRADDQNAAYEEDEEDREFASAMSSDNFSGADQVEPAKSKPVEKKDMAPVTKSESKPEDTKLSELSESKDLTLDESYIEQTEFAQENAGPSVSYRIETIYFANGSAVVDSQYNKKLRDIAKLAKSKKNAVVKVFGFASSRTRNTDIVSHKLANFTVSAERAQNVANALKRYGLKASQIETEALSDTAPAYQEVMPEGERLNRRAEIYITY